MVYYHHLEPSKTKDKTHKFQFYRSRFHIHVYPFCLPGIVSLNFGHSISRIVWGYVNKTIWWHFDRNFDLFFLEFILTYPREFISYYWEKRERKKIKYQLVRVDKKLLHKYTMFTSKLTWIEYDLNNLIEKSTNIKIEWFQSQNYKLKIVFSKIIFEKHTGWFKFFRIIFRILLENQPFYCGNRIGKKCSSWNHYDVCSTCAENDM